MDNEKKESRRRFLFGVLSAPIARRLAPLAAIGARPAFRVLWTMRLKGAPGFTTITDKAGRVWTAFGNATINTRLGP